MKEPSEYFEGFWMGVTFSLIMLAILKKWIKEGKAVEGATP